VAVEPYDDMSDVLVCRGTKMNPAQWDDLVERLRAFGVVYLGAALDSRHVHGNAETNDRCLAQLVRDLARAPEPRLRDALVALLLSDPTVADTVHAVLDTLEPNEPAYISLSARLLAAAGLQRKHAQQLAGLSRHFFPIDVTNLQVAGAPPFNEATDAYDLLRAAQALLAGSHPWIDYIDGWEAVAQHVIWGMIHDTVPAPELAGV
jgi:hypothetical protein